MRDLDPSASGLPEQFGKYSILGHLATGGMAEVYLARQQGIEGFEKVVVIKRIRPELTDSDSTAAFRDEARLVATLEHPNIAQVYEMDVVNGSYFFVMEYVHGADLRQFMEVALARKAEISLANAVHIMIGVCTALHFAHEKCALDGSPLNIIHRDVSPSNVLISHEGHVKVCDFGIAKATNRTVETAGGVLKGKFSYMSPEQCLSKPLDRRSDVFSIGTLLYELSTLSRLFNAPSDYELLRLIVDSPVPPPSRRQADYPPELERIVMRALARDPADRFQTAQEMQIALEDFAREQKLAMSSIHLGKVMGDLFEKRIEQWLRAQHKIGEGTPRNSGRMPAVGPAYVTKDPTISISHDADADETKTRASSLEIAAIAPVVTSTRRKRSWGWFVASLVVGLVACVVTLAESMLMKTDVAATRAALENHAERISSALDTAVRNAHARADGFATTPMLRAGIETDTLTLHDMFVNEMAFVSGRGEVLEVFQLQDGKPISMIRIPAEAAAIGPLVGRQTVVAIHDGQMTVTVGAPITGYKAKVVGALDLSQPVDLASVKGSIASHVASARLVGLGSEIALANGVASTEQPIEVAVHASGEVGNVALSVIATPRPAASVGWAAPIRYASLGLAVLLMGAFVTGRRSRR